MSADAIARTILFLAKRDIRNIIVTINPLTYLLFPVKELSQSLYFKLFLKGQQRERFSNKKSQPKNFN